MRVAVLGPLELGERDGRLAIGSPKQRTTLALLIARAGTVVSIEELIAELWGERPPRSALANARMYVANLRRLLAGYDDAPQVRKAGGGYLLTLDDQAYDLRQFRDLARGGRALLDDGDAIAAGRQCRQAIDLWRGRPLADVPTGELLDAWVLGVEQEHQRAAHCQAEALLRSGRADQAVDLARALLLRDPLREPTYELLMRAHHAGGDVAAALGVYDTARRRLGSELGIEPGPALRELRHVVLDRGDGRTAGPDGGASAAGPPPVPEPAPDRAVPRQLPADIPAFAGRAPHLDRLGALLHRATGAARVPVTVVVTGPAGVGKTALAVHWAHRVADRFPDGQLYVDLRGFGPERARTGPAEALRGLLDALGVPPHRMPRTVQAQAGLYRSILAGRRVLLVLDNARDADQVRPLLPGSAGALTVVTSRDQMYGLVTKEAAEPLPLTLMSPTEARELLAGRLGATRTRAAEAVDEIVASCVGLPLALAVVAARAAIEPDVPLPRLAADLRRTRRLDALAPDSTVDVRTTLSWSHHLLHEPATRLFSLLAAHPGPDVGLPAVASLAGLPVARARQLLADLVSVNLLAEHRPGRFRFHDLLREYAAERLDEGDPADRAAALRRLLDHYLHTACQAERLLNPVRKPLALPPPSPDVTVEPVNSAEAALAWFTRERAGLVAMVAEAHRAGLPERTWQLAWTFSTFFDTRAYWADWQRTQQLALSAARTTGDPGRQADAHRCLARACVRLDHPDEAYDHYEQAQGIYQETGELLGQAVVELNLSLLAEQQDHPRRALEHARRALDLFRRAGDRPGEGRALNGVGWCHARLGEHEHTLRHCTEALAVLGAVGDRAGQAAAWDSIGYARRHLGDHDEAITCHQRSLAIYRELGHRYWEASVLTHLGEAYLDGGDEPAARAAWRDAHDILVAIGHGEAEQVRVRLDQPASVVNSLPVTDRGEGR
ncbi:AfsR/SARP family transcriptional regulator [Micromonospora halophytica]|uniref:DNA-binding transcriptional activator of the SARP family n=1 Tax=Micromonospora halophytica TaxID=47864 RepID=A0A1C5I8E8_9ACTN|nr:BTAD domain-containing putative transcriptional regulator [Micromonospora halophytica]SCG54161.1 DNA-binding transcriptional activator of the SARP family [Micromonospora halophytica]